MELQRAQATQSLVSVGKRSLAESEPRLPRATLQVNSLEGSLLLLSSSPSSSPPKACLPLLPVLPTPLPPPPPKNSDPQATLPGVFPDGPASLTQTPNTTLSLWMVPEPLSKVSVSVSVEREREGSRIRLSASWVHATGRGHRDPCNCRPLRDEPGHRAHTAPEQRTSHLVTLCTHRVGTTIGRS